MKNHPWMVFTGVLLVGWGGYSTLFRSYRDIKFGGIVDLGSSHTELGIIQAILGLFLIYFANK